MPGYTDSMPLFSRSEAWQKTTRVMDTNGAHAVSEAGAYALYSSIITASTGQQIDDRPGKRTILGIRGAWPGTFDWNGNAINHFNDTLVVLWRNNRQYVGEFPVNTEPGPIDFGWYSSSFTSSQPTIQFHQWLASWIQCDPEMNEWGYVVMDDTNNNGRGIPIIMGGKMVAVQTMSAMVPHTISYCIR